MPEAFCDSKQTRAIVGALFFAVATLVVLRFIYPKNNEENFTTLEQFLPGERIPHHSPPPPPPVVNGTVTTSSYSQTESKTGDAAAVN